MTFKPLPILTAFTAVSLAILLLLGNWQWVRYSEKLAREAAGPPVWDKVFISPEIGETFQVRTVINGKPVWKVILPISMENEETQYAVIELIEDTDPPALRPLAEQPLIGETVEGIFTSPGGANAFTIEPNIAARTWYAFDTEALSAAYAYPPAAKEPLFEPVYLKYTDDEGIAQRLRNPYADYFQGDSLPPQRHFGYAITWWGLAIALFVIYFVFHHSQGRLRFRNSQ